MFSEIDHRLRTTHVIGLDRVIQTYIVVIFHGKRLPLLQSIKICICLGAIKVHSPHIQIFSSKTMALFPQ